MTTKTEAASLATVISEIKSRFKSAQASLVPLRGTEGFGGGYGLGYHDALGELLEFINDLPQEESSVMRPDTSQESRTP